MDGREQEGKREGAGWGEEKGGDQNGERGGVGWGSESVLGVVVPNLGGPLWHTYMFWRMSPGVSSRLSCIWASIFIPSTPKAAHVVMGLPSGCRRLQARLSVLGALAGEEKERRGESSWGRRMLVCKDSWVH